MPSNRASFVLPAEVEGQLRLGLACGPHLLAEGHGEHDRLAPPVGVPRSRPGSHLQRSDRGAAGRRGRVRIRDHLVRGVRPVAVQFAVLRLHPHLIRRAGRQPVDGRGHAGAAARDVLPVTAGALAAIHVVAGDVRTTVQPRLRPARLQARRRARYFKCLFHERLRASPSHWRRDAARFDLSRYSGQRTCRYRKAPPATPATK